MIFIRDAHEDKDFCIDPNEVISIDRNDRWLDIYLRDGRMIKVEFRYVETAREAFLHFVPVTSTDPTRFAPVTLVEP